MANTKVGYEFELYYGTAGSTASQKIENSRDADYDVSPTFADTSVRGDGSGPVIESERVAALKPQITWSMIDRSDDTILAALLAAGANGTAVAIRTKDHSSGKGYDGDCNITWRQGAPFRGEQTFEFTATPNSDLRTPQLWV